MMQFNNHYCFCKRHICGSYTHLMVHNCLLLKFQGFQVPVKVSMESCGAHAFMHTDLHTYKIKIDNF